MVRPKSARRALKFESTKTLTCSRRRRVVSIKKIQKERGKDANVVDVAVYDMFRVQVAQAMGGSDKLGSWRSVVQPKQTCWMSHQTNTVLLNGVLLALVEVLESAIRHPRRDHAEMLGLSEVVSVYTTEREDVGVVQLFPDQRFSAEFLQEHRLAEHPAIDFFFFLRKANAYGI
jgi:hypothetical protein